jgi:coenzyme F420-reducing hydrogenase beta subunit
MKIEKSSQDLENEVIFGGLCIHCGSCNAFCPHMDFNKETGQAYVVDECAETVGLCYNACPRSFLPVSEIELKMFGQNRVDLAVGVYKDIIQVKSKNKEDTLYNLVSAAFDSGVTKHFVLSKPQEKKLGAAFPVVVDNVKDAKQYIPDHPNQNGGPLVTGIGTAYLDKKRDIGIVANPCHLQGLAKILTSDFNTGAERTSLKIGFACSSGGMKGCVYCTDYSGEFSDITYSPYGGPSKEESFLIIRTDVGQKVVDHAIKNKLIEVTNKEPDLSKMKEFLNKKRKKNIIKLLGKDLITAKYLKLTVDEFKDMLE